MALPRASIVTGSAEAGGARPPSAVLKAMLLIAKKGSTHASRIEIDVPVWATGAKAGDVVEIREHRPMSHDKRWVVTKLIDRPAEG